MASGTGITVTCASEVVLMEPYWNPFVRAFHVLHSARFTVLHWLRRAVPCCAVLCCARPWYVAAGTARCCPLLCIDVLCCAGLQCAMKCRAQPQTALLPEAEQRNKNEHVWL